MEDDVNQDDQEAIEALQWEVRERERIRRLEEQAEQLKDDDETT